MSRTTPEALTPGSRSCGIITIVVVEGIPGLKRCLQGVRRLLLSCGTLHSLVCETRACTVLWELALSFHRPTGAGLATGVVVCRQYSQMPDDLRPRKRRRCPCVCDAAPQAIVDSSIASPCSDFFRSPEKDIPAVATPTCTERGKCRTRRLREEDVLPCIRRKARPS